MNQAEFGEHVGVENICPSIEHAVRASKALNQQMEQQSLLQVGGNH